MTKCYESLRNILQSFTDVVPEGKAKVKHLRWKYHLSIIRVSYVNENKNL